VAALHPAKRGWRSVREGKIVEHRVYFDQVEFLTQLGLMPAPGAGKR
jgi:hypothetical protein